MIYPIVPWISLQYLSKKEMNEMILTSYFEALTDCNSNDIWSFAPPETSSSIPDSQKVEYVREMEFVKISLNSCVFMESSSALSSSVSLSSSGGTSTISACKTSSFSSSSPTKRNASSVFMALQVNIREMIDLKVL
uniref:Uncharacterized protein n=1 Tax=Acrobeloides nanus TaxID=290746 RepID=A0A914DJR6_9BILA